jgi:RHS repeat-associated protein
MRIFWSLTIAIIALSFAADKCQAKYLDDETDLVYYGHRYYNPSTGRWLSRDPMGDQAFRQLSRQRSDRPTKALPCFDYSFVANCPIDRIDLLGLCCCDAATIAKQMQDLIARYLLANSFFESENIPRGLGHWSDYSCANENNAIGLFMSPSPSCWRCRLQELEESWKWPGWPINDHWVIICNSTPSGGSSGLSVGFDYWGDAAPGGPVGNGYPNIGEAPPIYYPYATDCNAKWNPDYGILKSAFPPPPPPKLGPIYPTPPGG